MGPLLSAIRSTEAEAARLRRELAETERRLAVLRRSAGLPPLPPTPSPEPPAPPLAQAQTRVSDAAAWLRLALAAGPMPARELRQRAATAGISARTLQRAAHHAGVQMKRCGFSTTAGSVWSLPQGGARD